MTITTRPVISLNEGRDYAFSAPFAALFWRDVIGYEPLVLLVEDEVYWRAQGRYCPLVLDTLRELSLDVRFVGHVEGYETARIGQNARQHASVYDDVAADTWLMMTDADLWPLNRDYHRQHETADAKAVALNGNLDNFMGKGPALERIARGVRFQTLPTCCITMRASEWRDCYGLTVGEPIAPALKRNMDAWKKFFIDNGEKTPGAKNFDMWLFDQDLVTYNLVRQSWFDDRVKIIARPNPMRRLDRGDWTMCAIGDALDSHIFKAPDKLDNWAKLREVVGYYLPQRIAWADEFRNRFRGAYVD